MIDKFLYFLGIYVMQRFFKSILVYIGWDKKLAEWRTDWITGIGLGFIIVLLPMVLMILGLKLGWIGG